MTESKVYYGCARDRRQGRGLAYRLIPRHEMATIRVAYRTRRQSSKVEHMDARAVRYSMSSLLQSRSTVTVMQNGDRINHRTLS